MSAVTVGDILAAKQYKLAVCGDGGKYFELVEMVKGGCDNWASVDNSDKLVHFM